MVFEKKCLKNGFQLMVSPRRDTQTATIMLGVGAGSRHEEEREAGLSHFIEHMLFKGSKKRPNALKISEAIDEVGGEINAFTGKDKTVYYAKVNIKHWELALDVIADMYLNPQFKSGEIEKEKGTILQELNMYEDMPMRNIEDVWEKLLYGRKKLGREIIGYKKTIRAFQKKDFLNYYRRFYIPNNSVLTVAGDLDVSQTFRRAENYFKDLSFQEKPKEEIIKEKFIGPQVKIKFKKSDQTHLMLGVKAYNRFHPDRYALSVLSAVLGGGMSSRLFIQVREKRGLAYYVRAGAEAYRDVGYWAASAGVEHKNLSQAVKIIVQEMKKLTQRKISSSELKKVKNYLKGRLVMNLESSDEIAGFLTNQELDKKEILLPKEIFQKIDKVTREDVKRVAQELFVSSRANLAVIGPHKNEKKLEKLLHF